MKNARKQTTRLSPAVVLLCGLFLAGCSTVGNKEITNTLTVAKVQVGTSTKADIERLFGKPDHVSASSTGKEEWNYTYTRIRTNPLLFVPIVGFFVDGVDMELNSLTVMFTPEGVVDEVTRGQGKHGG